MTGWLAPVADALERRSAPLELFIRDDDAGWGDERLFALLDCCAGHGCPIDLAVIPTAARDALADALIARRRGGARIGLHQHGYAHANHEADGRPCEFGSARSAAAQQRDIAEGRRLLLGLFGPALDPTFTPPWNRCVPLTGACVLAAGLAAISRDRTASPLATAGLTECAIDVDWFARAKGVRLDRGAWAARLAADVTAATAPLGLMLHHAVMDREELAALDELLTLLRAAGARGMLMRDVLARGTQVMQ